jgi:DNA modification methylase
VERVVTVELRDAIEGCPEWMVDTVSLLWTDPPYGTGKHQSQGGRSYFDPSDVEGTVESILRWLPALKNDATLAVCCDYRLAPVLTQRVVEAGWMYRGEVIWTFGLGRPRSSWWPVRHNNVLTFTQTETSGRFDVAAVPKTRRLAPKPGYVDDKPAGSVWDFTMSNTHPDRVGYPNQKPLELITPFVLAHTLPGELVVDPFCGSGSTMVAAVKEGREAYGCDVSPEAVDVARKRLENVSR